MEGESLIRGGYERSGEPHERRETEAREPPPPGYIAAAGAALRPRITISADPTQLSQLHFFI